MFEAVAKVAIGMLSESENHYRSWAGRTGVRMNTETPSMKYPSHHCSLEVGGLKVDGVFGGQWGTGLPWGVRALPGRMPRQTGKQSSQVMLGERAPEVQAGVNGRRKGAPAWGS